MLPNQIEIDYDRLAEKVASHLKQTRLADDSLWDSDDCAAFFKVSKRYFVDRLSKVKSFPQPVNGVRRWVKEDIQKWVRSN